MTDVFSIAQGNGIYNPPCALDNPKIPLGVAYDMSPKSTAFPLVLSAMKSIVFTAVGVYPPAKHPLVGLENPAPAILVEVKSPKSCAFPNVAIVTN